MFLESDRSLKSLIEIFLYEKAYQQSATIPGSKFPLHIHYLNMLKKWFPGSKIIHLIRDPRAILSSEINKKSKPRFPISKKNRSIYNIGLTFYVIIQYKWALKMHKRYSDDQNYLLCRFEDLVLDSRKTSKILCDFIGINFYDYMLDVKQVDSSYTDKFKKGINTDSLTRWEDELSKKYRNLIELFLSEEIRLMGYDL